MKILLTSFCFGPYHWYDDPIYSLVGFFLILTIVGLSIREKIRKSKTIEKDSFFQKNDNLYLEKDVLGCEKAYINHSEQSHKPADKSKFKFIMILVVFLLGLFLMFVYTPKKHSPYKATTGSGYIHHPDDQSRDYFSNPFYFNNYLDAKELLRIDTALVFKSNNIFENKEGMSKE